MKFPIPKVLILHARAHCTMTQKEYIAKGTAMSGLHSEEQRNNSRNEQLLLVPRIRSYLCRNSSNQRSNHIET